MMLIFGLVALLMALVCMGFADTAFGADHALKKKVIEEKLFREALNQMFWSPFIGQGSEYMIHQKMDLGKGRGDEVYIGLRTKLRGTGTVDSETLRGKEEPLSFLAFYTRIHQRRHGVMPEGTMARIRATWDLDDEARKALTDWVQETIDMDMTLALSGLANPVLPYAALPPSKTPGNTRIWYGGQTTAGVVSAVASDSLITNSGSAHLMGPAVLSLIKRKAKLCQPKIRPINITFGRFKGKQVYVLVLHPLQLKSFRECADWKNAMYYSEVRGDENPIFSGAEFMYDGVVVYEYENICTRLGAGGTDASEYFDVRSGSPDVCYNGTTVARALFCGAQAGVMVYGQKPKFTKQIDDYEEKEGTAISSIYRADRPRFDGNDFGVIAVDTAVAPD